MTPNNSHRRTSLELIGDFIQGDLGLARTYWLWGVVANICAQGLMLAIAAVSESRLLIGLSVYAFFIWNMILVAAIVGAADQYRGAWIWSALAKLSALSLFVQAFALAFDLKRLLLLLNLIGAIAILIVIVWLAGFLYKYSRRRAS